MSGIDATRDDQPPPAAKPRSRIRLIVQAVFSLALVVVLFYYLLKDVDLAQVWAEIRAMTWREDAILVVLAAWNLATYGLLWISVTPGLGFGRAMVMTQAASAVTNTVPTVGPAIGTGLTYAMFRSWGISGSRTSAAVVVSGVWNTFAKLGLPVLALALVLLQGGAGGGRVTLALAGIAALVTAIVVFALLLRSEELARRFGLLAGRVASRLLRLIRRPAVQGWELATVRFRTRTLELLEHGWVPITAATLVSQLSLYVVLLACLRGRGQRRRGLLGPGAGGVCVHAADYHGAGHPRQRGGGGVDADRAAGGRRRRPGAGDRRGAGVPGADLGAADPGRGRLLPVVAAQPARARARHRRWPAGSHPQPCDGKSSERGSTG
jgi:hypothetical protein